MNMQEVKSSNIKKVGYDPTTNMLAVQFGSGATYHYKNVTADQCQKFLAAKSIGQHFAQHFKRNEKHPFELQGYHDETLDPSV